MKTDSTKSRSDAAEGNIFLGENWFDPLEEGVRSRIRGFIEELLERNSMRPWRASGTRGLYLPDLPRLPMPALRRATGTAIANVNYWERSGRQAFASRALD